MTRKPEILAPAGDTQSFLAAMAAGADAVYLGLKHFSARMQADNFGSAELSRMVELANENGRRIYVAFNTLVKPDDVPAAGRLIARLARDVKPHGLIIQDPGVLALARQAGYEGGLFLSTLANLTHPASLLAAKELGADRVILPRELSIDEVKQISAACPEGLDLEMFIHGALVRLGPLLLVELYGRQERPARALRAALPPRIQAAQPFRAVLLLPRSLAGRACQNHHGHPAPELLED